MHFQELVKKRRSIHHFEPGYKLTEEQFRQIIDMVRFTPSGYNAQPWRFILIQNEENLKKLSHIAFNQQQLLEAGNAILVVADTEMGRDVDDLLKDWVRFGYCTEEEVPVYRNSIAKNRHPDRKHKMALRNGSLAAMTLMFAIEEVGLNSCPMMGFGQKEAMQFFEIPEDFVPIMLFAVGIGLIKEEKSQLPRKSVDKLIYREKFNTNF